MTGPISGLRVLDLSDSMAGAICTMLLADYGAEVVRVEPPGGGLTRRTGGAVTWDRGKRSLLADLGVAADGALVRRLARTADVVIEGAAPARRGLDWPALARANPALVFCKLTAYGPREGDDGSNAHEFLAAARLGVMAALPGHRDGPIAPGSPTLAYSTGLMAAIAILAAIRARLVTGLGDRVEVSFEDGFLAQRTMGWKSERGVNFVAGKSRTGELDTGRLRLILKMFECADGGRVQIHTGAAGAFMRTMEVLGLTDRISPVIGAHEMACPLTDEDMVVMAEVPAIFRSRTAEAWCERFWAREVACLPVLPPGAAFSDAQVRHAGLIRRVRDPELGEIEIVGPVASFSETPGEIRGPAPRLGQDNAALRSKGWASPGLGAGRRRGALEHPLDGVRIVEFSSYFAAPYGSRLLASLGAEVIKVEPTGGDVFRAMVDPFAGGNWGKRAIAFDLKAPEGRKITAALLASADVVQNNMRPGTGERLGVDAASARAANPHGIYHYAPGYGSTGPKSRLLAFAPLISGFTGALHMFGGPGNAPHMGFGNEDYFGGEVAAATILLALIHRERTGQGQSVESPLLHSSLLVVSEWFLKDGRARTARARVDQALTGFGPFHRLYQCLDGWIALACTRSAEHRAVKRVVLPPGRRRTGAGEAAAEALAYEFFARPAASWVAALREVGVPCVEVSEADYYDDYLGDDAQAASGRLFEFEHPSIGKVRGPDLMFRAARFKGRAGAPAPALGADSRAILRELGLGDDAEALIARGLVVAADPPPRTTRRRAKPRVEA